MYSGIFSTQIGIGNLREKRIYWRTGFATQSNGKIRQKFPDRFSVAQSDMRIY